LLDLREDRRLERWAVVACKGGGGCDDDDDDFPAAAVDDDFGEAMSTR
jgi:hypothetical protein